MQAKGKNDTVEGTMGFLASLFGKDDSRRPAIPRGDTSSTLILGGAGEDAERFRQARSRLWIADIRRAPGVSLLADLSKRFPFRDGAFDEIVSLEFIEHVSHRELEELLAECARVLRPGGRWLSGCPDMQVLVSWFDRRCECVKRWKADPACPRCGGRARITTKRWLRSVCGNQEVFGTDRVVDTHKNVLWFESLEIGLKSAGFRDVRRGDSRDYYEEGMAESRLVVEATRTPEASSWQ